MPLKESIISLLPIFTLTIQAVKAGKATAPTPGIHSRIIPFVLREVLTETVIPFTEFTKQEI